MNKMIQKLTLLTLGLLMLMSTSVFAEDVKTVGLTYAQAMSLVSQSIREFNKPLTPLSTAEARVTLIGREASNILRQHQIHIPSNWILKVAKVESAFGTNTTPGYVYIRKNGRRVKVRASRASGIMQVIPSTRRAVIRQYPWVKAYKGKLSEVLIGGLYLHMLKTSYKVDKLEKVYCLYLTGPAVGSKIIKHRNRHVKVNALIPQRSIINNRGMFVRHGRYLTAGQLLSRLLRKLNS